MIRWCAYCQRYQGEAPPYEDYSSTHTICERCVQRKAFLTQEPPDLAQIRRFFGEVGRPSSGLTAQEVLRRGTSLGLDPVDLLLGIIQPVLYDIGARWARAEASIAEEQRVSALCQATIQLLLERNPEARALMDCEQPTVLLVSAENNYHTLGIQILEVFLLRHRVPTYAVYPGVPVSEAVALVHRLAPRVVGISAAIPEHVRWAQQVANRLAEESPLQSVRVAVGGFAAHSPSPVVSPPLLACRELHMFLALVRGHRTPSA